MSKIFKNTCVIMLGLILFSPVSAYTNEPVIKTTMEGGSFKLINDTGKKISIHTGSGFVTLQKGGSTSISCNIGKEVRHADSGSKGDVIFEIESEHCGKTLKLSSFM